MFTTLCLRVRRNSSCQIRLHGPEGFSQQTAGKNCLESKFLFSRGEKNEAAARRACQLCVEHLWPSVAFETVRGDMLGRTHGRPHLNAVIVKYLKYLNEKINLQGKETCATVCDKGKADDFTHFAASNSNLIQGIPPSTYIMSPWLQAPPLPLSPPLKSLLPVLRFKLFDVGGVRGLLEAGEGRIS